MNGEPDRAFGVSGFWLKLTALAAMACDHVGAVVLEYGTPEWWVCRMIGRLAFPIFCFFVAEALRHTRSRPKYLLRLLIFAVVSEIPFDLAFSNTVWDFSSQNVMFTFLFAALGVTLYEKPDLLAAMERRTEDGKDTYASRQAEQVVRMFIPAVCIGLGYALNTDYGAFGVGLVYAFYFPPKKSARFLLSAVTIVVLSASYYYDFGTHSMVWRFFFLECIALAALPLIMLYNGQRGPKLKWTFYVFYPAHLLLLWAAANYIIPALGA